MNGSAPGASSNNTAAGTWGVNNAWSTSLAGTAGTSGWTSGQQAVFSAGTNATGAYTVSVSGNQVASGLVFEEGTVTLNNGIITLTNGIGNATLSVGSTNVATINSQILGANGLVKDGTGTLLLGGSNTFTGVTDLKQGTILVTKRSSLGQSTLEMDGGGFGASGAAVSLDNAVLINADSSVVGSQSLTFNGNVTQQNGSHTLTINNSGQTTFAGATFALGNNNQSTSLTLNTVGGSVTVSGSIQNGSGNGNDSLVKTGDGTLILTGNNTFSGGLQLNSGSLLLGNDAGAGLGTLVLGNGTTIAATNGARTIANNLTIAGDVTFAGTDSLTFSDSFDLGSNRTFTIWNTTIFNGVISGANDSLTKLGTGTLVLNGANTFGGILSSLSVNAGTVAFGNNSAAGTAANWISLNGGSIQASGGARALVNPILILNDSGITGSQNLTLSGLALNVGGNHTLTVSNTALTTLSGSSLTLASLGNAGLTLNVSASSGGMIVSNTIGNGLGIGSLTNNGGGNLTLAGASPNTFSGGFTVNAGTVTAGKVNALGSGPLNVNAATVNIGAFNQTVGMLTLAGGTINGTQGTLTAPGFQAQSGTINASLAGAGALTKTTAGTLTLTASNIFSGGTIINGGTVLVNNTTGSGTGTGAVTVNSGGILGGTGNIAGQVTLNLGGALSPGTTGPGPLSTASEIWNAGAKFIVQVKDANGGEGVGWDLLKVTGTLTVNASSANPLFVDLRSLTLANLPGPVFNFTNTLSYNWRIVTTTGGIVFNAGQNASTAFSLSLANFSNAVGSGHFSLGVANGNHDLVLTFTPTAVPEPKAWSMVAIGFLLLFFRNWSYNRHQLCPVQRVKPAQETTAVADESVLVDMPVGLTISLGLPALRRLHRRVPISGMHPAPAAFSTPSLAIPG